MCIGSRGAELLRLERTDARCGADDGDDGAPLLHLRRALLLLLAAVALDWATAPPTAATTATLASAGARGASSSSVAPFDEFESLNASPTAKGDAVDCDTRRRAPFVGHHHIYSPSIVSCPKSKKRVLVRWEKALLFFVEGTLLTGG